MWDVLFTLFSKYGPIPRLLFEEFLPPHGYSIDEVEDGTGEVDASLQHRVATYDRLLERKIVEALKLDPCIALSEEDYGVNSSHVIFTIHPSKMKMYQYVSGLPVYGLAAPYIGRRIGAATNAISLNNARRLYDFLLRQGDTNSVGWIFEARMHLIFQRGGRFKATKIGGSANITIEISPARCRVFSKVSDLGSLLRKQPRSGSKNPDVIGGYFNPDNCNFCSVGSFAVTKSAKTKKPVLIFFQMTVRPSRPFEAQGLASIWAEIPEELQKTPPILVFVVPADVAETFSEKQTVDSVMKTTNSNLPDFGQWEQYVFAVSAESLWENATPGRKVGASSFLLSCFRL
jgi:hypothetical protein